MRIRRPSGRMEELGADYEDDFEGAGAAMDFCLTPSEATSLWHATRSALLEGSVARQPAHT
eukprot:296422-Heterocapsa_arctica.AAC.1